MIVQSDYVSKFNQLKSLVGDIKEEQLKHVEYYVGDHMGICIPSTGFCEYALKRQHTHPSYSFAIFPAEFNVIDDTEYFTDPYHYVTYTFPPDFPHEEKNQDTFKRYIALFIDKDYFENCYQLYHSELPINRTMHSFLVPAAIMQPINQFIREAEVSLPGRDSIIHSLTELIAHQLIRSLLDITTGSIKSGNYRTMYHIVDYMYQHFDKKLEVSELAKLAGLSESYFTRTFKKETHFSPMEYLNKIRMNNAKNLLKHSYENISEVALMCGFNNCSHFTSRFTKENGISPTAYKKNYRISG